MGQFLYKTELLFDESLVSALLGNSFKFKVFLCGCCLLTRSRQYVPWGEVTGLSLPPLGVH